MKNYKTTIGGFRRFRKMLANAKADYFKVCASNEDAAGAGDNSVWHDNFAYEENQRRMHQLATRVSDLEILLSKIELVAVPFEAPQRVEIGSVVKLWSEKDKREQALFIAGYEDGDPAEQRISYTSPLGKELLGKEEGDVCRVPIRKKLHEYEILEILPSPPEERI